MNYERKNADRRFPHFIEQPRSRRNCIMQSLIVRLLVVAVAGAGLSAVLQATPPADPKAGSVTLNAKPEPIAIYPARSAVIVVDMENDFAAKGGMFDRAGVDVSGAQKAIATTARVLTAVSTFVAFIWNVVRGFSAAEATEDKASTLPVWMTLPLFVLGS